MEGGTILCGRRLAVRMGENARGEGDEKRAALIGWRRSGRGCDWPESSGATCDWWEWGRLALIGQHRLHGRFRPVCISKHCVVQQSKPGIIYGVDLTGICGGKDIG